MNHLYIAATIIFAILSQLIIRWQMDIVGPLPESALDKGIFVARIFFRPWVLLAFIFTFLSGVAWMLTLTKFDISYAYPFTSLSFVIMLALGVLLFGEPFSLNKLFGTLLVIAGLIVITRG